MSLYMYRHARCLVLGRIPTVGLDRARCVAYVDEIAAADWQVGQVELDTRFQVGAPAAQWQDDRKYHHVTTGFHQLAVGAHHVVPVGRSGRATAAHHPCVVDDDETRAAAVAAEQ